MSQQGRREPASDLPLRELGCDSRHLALPLHVFSWLPSLAWITAVTSPLSWYKERKSPPSWRSGACGLQRLIAPGLVFSPAGHRLLPLPFQHKAQLIAHRIKLQQSVRRSVCHARPSCLRASAYSGALSVNFEAGGEFCVQGCSDLCYKWDCNWWLPWEASATCSVPVHPLYAWLLTKLPAAGLSRLCNQPGGGSTTHRSDGEGRDVATFLSSPILCHLRRRRSNVGTRRRPICSFRFWTCFSVFCRKRRRLFGILKDICGKRIDCMILREAAVRPVICLISQRAVWCLANNTVPIWIQRMNSHRVHY